MVSLEDYPKQRFYAQDVHRWPNLKDDSSRWHASFFKQEPIQFMKAVIAHGNSVPDPAPYYKAIRSIIDAAFTPGDIQAKIVMDRASGEPFLISVYPDWGEWYQSYRIMYDLQQWLKDTIYFHNNAIENEEQREPYRKDVKRLLETYGPENWQQLIPAELMQEWSIIFLAEEIKNIQMAKIDLQNKKNQKMIGLGILGIFGIVGVSAILKKKKK